MDEFSSEDIARIEERIESLREAIARCRKLSLVAKLMIGAGTGWIAFTLAWLIPYLPSMLFGSLAAVIGGIVLLGSNSTTWSETEAALATSEAMRAEWIGRQEMRLIGDDSKTVH